MRSKVFVSKQHLIFFQKKKVSNFQLVIMIYRSMDKPIRCMLPFLIITLMMVIGFGLVFIWSSNNFKVIMVSSQNMQLLDGKMTIFFFNI